MPIVGEAIVRVRVISAGMDNAIRDEVRRQLGSPDIDRDAENTGRRIGQRVRRGLENDGRQGGLSRVFAAFGSDSAKKFGDAFNLGIGRARMGRGLISILTAAGPSIISAGAAMGTALASEILTAISAIGPGLIGLGGVIATGFSTALINFGLLAAAFSSGVAGLDDLKTSAKGLVKELGTPIAQTMLPGMQAAVQTLRDAIPQINDLLSETGKRFGEIAKGAAETLVSGENMSRLRDILSTNNSFLEKFGVGLNNLITSFLILVDAAKPFVDYLGDGLVKFSDWLKNLLEAKEASGELTARAQQYLDKWQQLWQTIKDFAAGLSNLFKAIAPVGDQLADSMGKVAENFRAWTGDETNQARITAFFQKAHDLSSKIFEILGKLFQAGGNAFMEADFTNLFAVLDSIANNLAPAIAQIWNQIQEAMGPHLVQIVDNLGGAFAKIADSGVIGKIADMVGTLLEKVTDLLNTDLGSWVLGLGVAWALFGGILQPVISLVSALVTTLGGVGAAVAAVVGFFVLMWQNSQNLRDAIGGLVDIVGGKFSEIWDKISPKLEKLWDNIQKLAGAIGDRLAPIIDAIGPVVGRFLDLLGSVLSFIFDQLGELIGFFADLFSGDFEGAWEHAKTIISNFWNFIQDLFTKLRLFIGSIFSGLWGLVVEVWQSVWNKVSDIASNVWNNIWSVAESIWSAIVSFFSGIWDDITSGFVEMGTGFRDWWNNLWEWTGQKLSAAWDWITGILSSAWGAFTSAIMGLGTQIQTWWNDLWTWVGDTAASIWNWITTTVSDAWNGLINGIMSIGNTLQTWWNDLWTWVGNTGASLWTWIQETLSNIWQGIVNVVHFLFDPWVDFFSQLWTTIQNGVSTAWNAITSFFSSTWESIRSTAASVWNSITSFLSSTWESIKSTASSVWNSIVSIASSAWNSVADAIRNAVDSVTSWLSGIWDDIRSTASSVWNSIVGIASSVWSSVKDAIVQPIIDAWNAVTGWISNIKDAVTGAVEWITGKVGEANDKLNEIISKQADAGAVTANMFNPDAVGGTPMAEGGVVPPIPGGWHINVGEAGRPERIEPLDSQGLSRRDRALIAHIVSQMSASGGASGDTHVTVMLDGRQLAGVVSGVVTKNLDGQARDIRKRRRASA